MKEGFLKNLWKNIRVIRKYLCSTTAHTSFIVYYSDIVHLFAVYYSVCTLF